MLCLFNWNFIGRCFDEQLSLFASSVNACPGYLQYLSRYLPFLDNQQFYHRSPPLVRYFRDLAGLPYGSGLQDEVCLGGAWRAGLGETGKGSPFDISSRTPSTCTAVEEMDWHFLHSLTNWPPDSNPPLILFSFPELPFFLFKYPPRSILKYDSAGILLLNPSLLLDLHKILSRFYNLSDFIRLFQSA